MRHSTKPPILLACNRRDALSHTLRCILREDLRTPLILIPAPTAGIAAHGLVSDRDTAIHAPRLDKVFENHSVTHCAGFLKP